MKTYIPIFFLLLQASWSQVSIEVPLFDFSHLNTASNTIQLFNSNRIYSIDLNSYDISEKEIDSFDSKRNYFIENINGNTYYFQNGTGKVFKEKPSKFERIDNSLIENFLIGSTFFRYSDTIFRYGGYGFWTVFDKMLFFDLTTNQWEIYKDLEKGRMNSFIFEENDIAYFLGGYDLSKQLPQKDIHDFNIDILDLETNEFKSLGKSSILFNGKKIISNVVGNYFLDNDRSILKISFENNTVFKYFSNSLNTKIQKNYKVYLYNDNFIFFSKTEKSIYLNIFPSDLFISIPKEQFPLIKGDKISINFLYAVIALFILLVIWIIFKRINTIYLSPSNIKYKFNNSNVTQIQHEVLSFFIENQEVKSIQIDEIVFEKELSRASNYKKKNELINSINSILKTITTSKEDILLYKKYELDSRIKVFYIDPMFKLKRK